VPDKLTEIEKGWRTYAAADGPPVSDVLWLIAEVREHVPVDTTATPGARTAPPDSQ
jgi:hypothetical protein